MKAPNLKERPPRSPRVRLGGYVVLPRMLDKCRALLAGTNGEYNYACPLDQRWLSFSGIDPEALKAEVALGKNDGEILEWVQAHTSPQRTDVEIAAWSMFQASRIPSDVESRGFFQEIHSKLAPHRNDVASWFDLLDLDDYVSFGGAP